MCQVCLLEVRMQQPEQVQKELDEVRANAQRLRVQAASSATLAEQLTPHIIRLEQLAMASGDVLNLADSPVSLPVGA